jgi:hypothetical protein
MLASLMAWGEGGAACAGGTRSKTASPEAAKAKLLSGLLFDERRTAVCISRMPELSSDH